MVRRARWIYPALVCVMIALYYAIPLERVTIVAAVGTLTVIAILWACIVRRPARRAAWLLIAIAVFIVAAGEVTFNVLATGGNVDVYPSGPDVLYLAAYPPAAIGLLWLGMPRAPSQDWSGMIETAALTLVGSLIIWVTLVLPTIRTAHIGGVGKGVLVAGWVGDVVVLVSALRLITVWPRKPAAWMLALAVTSIFLGDVRYGYQLLHGTWQSGGQVDAGILVFFAFTGWAAVTLSMATMGSRRSTGHKFAFGSLVVLALALLIVPTVLLYAASPGPITTPVAIVGVAIGMLVILRLFYALVAHRRSVIQGKVLWQATRSIGLAMTIDEVMSTLYAALVGLVRGEGPSSVRLADTASASSYTPTELRVPVPDGLSAEPAREIVYTAPAVDLTELQGELIGLGTQAAIALQRIDLTGRVRASEEEQHVLAYRAAHDGLTGLANGELFRSELRLASQRVEPSKITAVLFVDLDDFKSINDTLGHEAGDAVLVSTAQRIRGCLRQVDLGARLGGDEFAVLLRDIAEDADAYVVARRLTEVLAEPTMVAGIPVVCRGSVGLATAHRLDQYDALLRRADTALYAAKAAGKGHWRPYDPQMQSPLRRGSDLGIELERALRHPLPATDNGLTMHYQPIVELATDRVVGFESLIRWHHPERGMIKVPELIALAEQTGLIVPLGDWVFAHSFRDGLRLTETGCYLSVNVSVAQLRLPGFMDRIDAQLDAVPIDPERVVIEITESQLVRDDEQIWDDLSDLRRTGIRIAIDDYGTGYASLSYLRHPVIDIVKLDRRFIERIGTERSQTLVRAVLGLTHDLKLPLVAEGIEDEATRSALVELGCTYGQGHLFAPAMPLVKALEWRPDADS